MTTDPTSASVSAEPASDPMHHRRYRYMALWILLGALAGALIIDQVSKELALHALLSGPTSLGGVRLQLVANRGILLGFPAPSGVIVLATIGVVIAALRSARGSRWTMSLAYGLLAGGALGNLADRFQDRHFFPSAAVVDWISAGRITFNLADVFLIAGVALLLFLPSSDDSPSVPVGAS
jgi:signal peptidase II